MSKSKDQLEGGEKEESETKKDEANRFSFALSN